MSTPPQRPTRPARHWLWDDAWPVVRRELCIAATVAGSLTFVLLARRLATEFLGQGLLNAEIFAGSTVVNELVTTVEERVRRKEATHARSHRSAARPARTQKRGSSHGNTNGSASGA